MQPTYSMRHAALLMVCCTGASSWAQDTPPITVTAAYTVQTDDNLFRRWDGAPDVTPRSDRLGISTLGLLFHTVQGLQQFELDASVVNYQYQENSELGYTAHNYAAAWRWAVTPRVRGNLTANQQQHPNSSTGNTEPNQQTQASYRADAEYEVDGLWHVVAGASQDKVSNQNAVTIGQEYSSHALDAGLRYDSATGSSVKVTLQATDGSYLNEVALPVEAIDSKFHQIDSDLHLHWALSSASSADFNASAFQRSHPTYAQRDFSGLNWGAALNWSLSGKTALNLGLQHTLGAYATGNTNYTQTDLLSWGWSWQTSSKTQLRVHQDFAQISYHGSPFGAAESPRLDNTRDTSLSWVWQPRTQWQISTALHQIARNTNVEKLDYVSNQLSLTAQFSY
jgi:exopolysaccharide biosynthesis operon protein EpsL